MLGRNELKKNAKMFKPALHLNFALEHTQPDYLRTGGNQALNFHAIRVKDVLKARTAHETLRMLDRDRELLFDKTLPKTGNLREIMVRLTRLLLVRLQQVPERYFRRHPSSINAGLKLIQTALDYWQDSEPDMRKHLRHARDVLRVWRVPKSSATTTTLLQKIKTKKPRNPFHGGKTQDHR